MTHNWFARCVACSALVPDGGKRTPCCGLGPLCDECYVKHRHEEIATTADDTCTITVTPFYDERTE